MPNVDYTPPTELHAVAVKAVQLFDQGGGHFSPRALASLVQDVEALYGDIKQLADAVNSLGAVMLYAQQQGADRAALEIMQLIRMTKPEFERFNSVVKQEIQDEAQAARASLLAFRGEDPRLKAQQHGSRPPAGSVPLSSILPNPATRRPAASLRRSR